MPDVHWFGGATINYARNALRSARTDPARAAIKYSAERGRGGTLEYAELEAEVARVARGLRALGVRKGDRVAAFVPNVPESVIGLLAVASIGAIWSSCSPDFGVQSVIDRFAQIEPKVLIAVDGYRYNGKEYQRGDAVRDIAAALPTLAAIVTVPLLNVPPVPPVKGHGSGDPRPPEVLDPRIHHYWGELGADAEGGELVFEEVAFEHPLWVV
jgi:acetoacetyl-CoA synthetase